VTPRRFIPTPELIESCERRHIPRDLLLLLSKLVNVNPEARPTAERVRTAIRGLVSGDISDFFGVLLGRAELLCESRQACERLEEDESVDRANRRPTSKRCGGDRASPPDHSPRGSRGHLSMRRGISEAGVLAWMAMSPDR
jgi:hypothetical protein